MLTLTKKHVLIIIRTDVDSGDGRGVQPMVQ